MTQRPSAEPAPAFEVSFRPDPAALASARHQFESWLRDTGSLPERADDLAVVFSEVASNAMEAHDGNDAPVSARAWRDDDEIVLSVTNAVSGDAIAERWDLEDPLRGGGRGLMIVRALTDDVDVEVVDQIVTVECRLRIGRR